MNKETGDDLVKEEEDKEEEGVHNKIGKNLVTEEE